MRGASVSEIPLPLVRVRVATQRAVANEYDHLAGDADFKARMLQGRISETTPTPAPPHKGQGIAQHSSPKYRKPDCPSKRTCL